MVAHSIGGGAGTTRTVGTPAGCHCPLHSIPSTLHCSYLHFTTSWLAVTVHTLHHIGGPRPGHCPPSTFNQCSAPVSHIFPSVELHCGNCSKSHQICASMKSELCGVWTSQQFVEKCALQSKSGNSNVLRISTQTYRVTNYHEFGALRCLP